MPLVLPEKSHAVAADLRRLLGNEKVRDDGPSLTAYAVDASIYRMVPQAVALPDDETDIHRLIRYAATHGIPLTPRPARPSGPALFSMSPA